MAERRLEERFEAPDGGVIGEWEPSTRVDVTRRSSLEIRRIVRNLNEKAKQDGEYVRFRSVAEEDAFT